VDTDRGVRSSIKIFDATRFTAIVEKTTTLILLMGIRIAATNGVRCPETAKLNAIALYRNEITNPIFKMVVADFAR
jgi:hypothetical protein